ncbi:MAG: ABC transporter permease, partial [Pseudomonadota bacterium]
MQMSPINQRRWQNFRANKRAYWSLIIFSVLFTLSLFAEFLANDKPIVVNFRGEYRMPILSFYSERDFAFDYGAYEERDLFATEARYKDVEIACLIASGGLVEPCLDDPEGTIELIDNSAFDAQGFDPGWTVWPPIRNSFNNSVDRPGAAPLPPSSENLLGTDDTKRDVLARVIYGFRLSIFFTIIVTSVASVIGIIAGAVQGYFGGWIDLGFQRFLEIFSAVPSLYVIIILFAILGRSFWLLVALSIFFGWPALTGLVRAEFLRARNFEYVRAAQALGVSNWTIMFRHMLPNAMVATLTMLPFIVTGTI